jgi:hypothetical protein
VAEHNGGPELLPRRRQGVAWRVISCCQWMSVGRGESLTAHRRRDVTVYDHDAGRGDATTVSVLRLQAWLKSPRRLLSRLKLLIGRRGRGVEGPQEAGISFFQGDLERSKDPRDGRWIGAPSVEVNGLGRSHPWAGVAGIPSSVAHWDEPCLPGTMCSRRAIDWQSYDEEGFGTLTGFLPRSRNCLTCPTSFSSSTPTVIAGSWGPISLPRTAQRLGYALGRTRPTDARMS